MISFLILSLYGEFWVAWAVKCCQNLLDIADGSLKECENSTRSHLRGQTERDI